jgi:hypothetical protein
MRLQTIMESIQWIVPPDSTLAALAQQGVEAVGNIIAVAPTTGNHRGEPSGGNGSHDREKKSSK